MDPGLRRIISSDHRWTSQRRGRITVKKRHQLYCARGVAIRSEKYTQKFMRHLIAVRAQRIWACERMLLLREAKKRLATIGRTPRQNTGRRGGSSFSLVEIK